MGRIVDSYTNILTVKLFARPRDEDNYVRDAVDAPHRRVPRGAAAADRCSAPSSTCSTRFLIAGAGAIAIWLWQRGSVEVGAIAMVLPLTLQLTNMSRQIAMQITDIFEEIGVVQEGMITIAKPLQLVDPRRRDRPLEVREGKISFEDVRFGYGRETGVLDGLLAHGAAGREDRPGRPLRRRQVDRGQSAAALLRSRRRPHPDRRPGHLTHARRNRCARRFRW